MDRTHLLNRLLRGESAPVTKSDVVWHYTDELGLLGILSTHTLWATSALMLNDTSELSHGLSVVRQSLDSLSGAVDTTRLNDLISVAEFHLINATRTFVLSASRHEDSLSQWRAYSGSRGYAIGLATNEPLDLLVNDDADPSSNASDPKVYASAWRDVLYEVAEHDSSASLFLKEADELLKPEPGWSHNEVLSEAAFVTGFDALIPTMKHRGFKDEAEVRIVAQVSTGDGFLSHRAGKYGVTPYIRLTGVPHSSGPVRRVDYRQHAPSPLPIRQIRIGPTADPRAAELGLQSALDSSGYSGVGILHTTVPYR